MKEVCGICKYGDGKWKERVGQKMPNLPACEKCTADGWSIEEKEVVEALKNDSQFKVYESSPYFQRKDI